MVLKRELRLCSWNINGLISKKHNKLNDPEFIQEIKSFDIIALQEVHVKNEGLPITLNSFDVFMNNGILAKNSRIFGGLAFLVRKNIRSGVKLITSPDKDFMWLKLKRDFFNLDKDLYLCNVYIPPRNSTFLKDGDCMIEQLENELQQYSTLGYTMLCGDFNARVSDKNDFIELDENKYLPNCLEYKPDTIITKRTCKDNTYDERGKQLIELCIASGMRILNGRFVGDSQGYFTCHKSKGSSVIDYMMINEEFLKHVLYFHVHHLLGTLSDHCKLSVMLRIKFSPQPNDPKDNQLPDKYVWETRSGLEFKETLNSRSFIKQFESYISSTHDISKEGVENATKQLNTILISAADLTLKKKRKNVRKRCKNKKWFDADLVSMRRNVDMKGSLLSKYPKDPAVRNSFYKTLKDYNRARKYKRKKYKEQILDKIDLMKNSDPKTYWNLVNELCEKEEADICNDISLDSWYDYFSDLNDKKRNLPNEYALEEEIKTLKKHTKDKYLNKTIEITEIEKAIRKLKTNKSAGPDGICNEMLKCGENYLLHSLQVLFNLILSSGIYPSGWALAHISPIYKNGNHHFPSNYRGIAIMSCLGKLFNAILNTRIEEFLKKQNYIDKSQIGFQKNCRTTDHLFTLKTIIDKYINQKSNSLFVCYVDFQKAFDTISHTGLKYKMLKSGINGNIFNTIIDMYAQSIIAVKSGCSLTRTFPSKVGVRQGDVLSPNLFKLYINDLPDILKHRNNDLVSLNNETLPCLLYADDLVLCSSSREGLQNQLHQLYEYCNQWGLTVNLKKTKAMHFNKKGILPTECFKYNDNELEYAQTYKYLGIDIHCTGSFQVAIQNLYEKAVKAMFKLTRSICNYKPSSSTMFHLFDMMVKPILLYNCEIWGTPKLTKRTRNLDIDSLLASYDSIRSEICQQKYCRYILGVHKKTTLNAIYGETGRHPLSISIITNMLKFWNRMGTIKPDTLLYNALMENISLANSGINSWTLSLHHILKCLDLNNYKNPFNSNDMPIKDIINKIKNRYSSIWKNNINPIGNKGKEHNKLRTYVLFKTNHGKEIYLDEVNNPIHRMALAKFRTSSHKLHIETGRYKGLKVENRTCKLCSCNKVESECHMFSECPVYKDIRTTLFAELTRKCKNFQHLSDINKMIWALANPEPEVCKLVAKYIYDCFTTRDTHLSAGSITTCTSN